MVVFLGCCCHCLSPLFFFCPCKLINFCQLFLCHLEIHQIPLFLVMDYREQNSGRIWSKTPPHHLGVADREREMELNSRKSDLDQPGMWMDLVILFFFLLQRWKLCCFFLPSSSFARSFSLRKRVTQRLPQMGSVELWRERNCQHNTLTMPLATCS